MLKLIVVLFFARTWGFPRRVIRQRHLHTSVEGFSELVERYDGFIIDQWGVLHNGKIPYDGVLDCLSFLNSSHKALILLSNSSKRKESSFKGLEKVGIDPRIFCDIITSGELGYNLIKGLGFTELVNGSHPCRLSKAFVIGNSDDDIEYMNSADCDLAPPEEADFAIARGTFSIVEHVNRVKNYNTAEELMAVIDPWLERCKAAGLPLLVTNPDFYRPGSGAPMPGQIGERYERLGGCVYYVGKPYAPVYEACFKALEIALGSKGNLDTTRIAGVGDSLDHDILGADRAGIASIWTANGVHCTEMGVQDEGSPILPNDTILSDMFEKYGIRPSHTLASFRW